MLAEKLRTGWPPPGGAHALCSRLAIMAIFCPAPRSCQSGDPRGEGTEGEGNEAGGSVAAAWDVLGENDLAAAASASFLPVCFPLNIASIMPE